MVVRAPDDRQGWRKCRRLKEVPVVNCQEQISVHANKFLIGASRRTLRLLDEY